MSADDSTTHFSRRLSNVNKKYSFYLNKIQTTAVGNYFNSLPDILPKPRTRLLNIPSRTHNNDNLRNNRVLTPSAVFR